jgi:hypothetical protein
MTTTAPITRPVTTNKPQTSHSGRRTAALVASGIVMLGLAVGTTYAFVVRSAPAEQPQQVSAVQGIERPGADAKGFAHGTSTAVTVRGVDRSGEDAMQYARGNGLTAVPVSQPATQPTENSPQDHAYPHQVANNAT